MSENKNNQSNILKKGYQPTGGALVRPNSGNVQGGYQPTTSQAKPVNPPPKKP